MTQPNNFILSSDYATLKNDATGSLSVTLPSSTSVSASSVSSWTDTITIGVVGASLRARISTSKTGTFYASNTAVFSSTTGGTVFGSPTGYDIYCTVHRVSSTQVRLSVLIPNPYGDTLSISGMSQTITAHVATFLPPTP